MSMLRRLAVILIFLVCGLPTLSEAAAPLQSLVKWVGDGDTVVLAGGEKVRYLGINTPEIAHKGKPGEPYGEEARVFNKKLVLGKRVRLEFGDERRDRYGRLLAFVFLEDGTFVNGELVRHGYAHLLRRQTRLRYWDRLLEIQRQALREKRGIWSIGAVRPETYYLGNKQSWVFHRPHCSFGLKTASGNRIRFKDRYEALYSGFSPGRRCKP